VLVSLGISAVIGILLALFAHLLGTTLKRSLGVRGIRKRLGHFLGAAVIVTLVGAVIYAIAVIREQYVRLAEENANVSLDTLVGNGIVETARQAITDGLSSGSISLIMVNLLLFVGGTAIAFVRHDSDPDYENAVTERKKAEKRLNRLRSAYDKKHSAISREFSERLTNLERQIGAIDEEIRRLETEALNLRSIGRKLPRQWRPTSKTGSWLINRETGRREGTEPCPGAFATTRSRKLRRSLWGLAAALMTTFIVSLAEPGGADAAGRQDYCSFSQHTTLMLVDRTTAYDLTDQEVFKSSLRRLQGSLEVGDRLIIQTITGSYTESRKVFDDCMPGCPETGLMEWLTGSCRDVIATSDRNAFLKRAATVVRQMLNEVKSFETSDIAQTIAETTREISASPDRQITRLIVFSDMIENSRALPWSRLQSGQPKALTETLNGLGIKPSLEGGRCGRLRVWQVPRSRTHAAASRGQEPPG
jgi:hypothetical protein